MRYHRHTNIRNHQVYALQYVCSNNVIPPFAHPSPVHAVINETLRLFPPVPLNVREVRESGVILPPSDGTYIDADSTPLYVPAHTVLMYFPILTQQNTALWGDDASKFDPDRWLDGRLSKFTERPMIFTPFSGGPRMVRCMFCSPLPLQFRDVIPIPIPFHSFFHFLSLPLKTDPPCFINLTVPRPELRTQRINLPPHPPPPTIRHIHPRSRRPTRRILTPGTVALRGNRTRAGGTDLSPVRVDALRKGTFMQLPLLCQTRKG